MDSKVTQYREGFSRLRPGPIITQMTFLFHTSFSQSACRVFQSVAVWKVKDFLLIAASIYYSSIYP